MQKPVCDRISTNTIPELRFQYLSSDFWLCARLLAVTRADIFFFDDLPVQVSFLGALGTKT